MFRSFRGNAGSALVSSRFRRIRVAPFVVRRFSFFVILALSFVVISFLPFFVFVSCYFVFPSRFLVPFPFVVCRFVVRERISEGRVVFVRVSVFVRRLASCEVTFVGPFVDPLNSLRLFVFVRRVSFTMPDTVEKVTPVASSSADNVTSSAAPPVSSVPLVPSNVAAPSFRLRRRRQTR